MKVAVSAYPLLFHESFQAWQEQVENWVKEGAEQADILVFPEYGSMELVSLFPENIRQDLQAQILEMQNLWTDFQKTYADLARKYSCVIVAPSFPVKIETHFVNRAMVFSPKGPSGFQDKFFMTPFERFDWLISSGEKVLTVFETEFGNFGIQICYDSEFSIGSRLLVEAGADVLLLPSCTETIRGATRVHVGARARALENQCYTLVSQTIGKAEWSPAVDLNYGYTAAYSTPDSDFPEDGILQEAPHQQSGWLIQNLDLEVLKTVRANGGVRNFEDHGLVEYTMKNESIQIQKVKLY